VEPEGGEGVHCVDQAHHVHGKVHFEETVNEETFVERVQVRLDLVSGGLILALASFCDEKAYDEQRAAKVHVE